MKNILIILFLFLFSFEAHCQGLASPDQISFSNKHRPPVVPEMSILWAAGFIVLLIINVELYYFHRNKNKPQKNERGGNKPS